MRISFARTLFGQPDFRNVWLGRTSSAVGRSMVPVAMAMATLAHTGSGTYLGVVLASGTAVEIVFLLFGGVWADRFPRRTVMIGSSLFRAAVQATIGVLLVTGQARLWHVVLGTVCNSVASGVIRPAFSGLVADSVAARDLQQANALLSFSDNAAKVGGPALVGVLVAVVNPGWAFVCDAVTFLLSALFLTRVKPGVRHPYRRQNTLRSLREGWREVTARPWYWLNLVAHALWNMAFSALLVLGPVIAVRDLGGPAAWGGIAAGLAVGSLVGTAVALRIRVRRVLVVGNLMLTLGAFPFVALALGSPLYATIFAAAIATAGLSVLSALWETSLQQLIPNAVLSRVVSYDWMVSLSAAPIGYALAGPAMSTLGTSAVLLTAAALMVVPCTLIVLLPGVRAVRRGPDNIIAGPKTPSYERTTGDHSRAATQSA